MSDFLDYNRIENNKFKLIYKEINFHTICDEVKELYKRKLEEHNNKLTFEITFKKFNLINDPNRTKQILINLISNANKFSKNGLISVKIDEFNGYVRIMVRDNGSGMKKEVLDKIGEDYMTFNNKSNENE